MREQNPAPQIPLHQRFENSDVCIYCGKPMIDWKELEAFSMRLQWRGLSHGNQNNKDK